MTKEFWENQAEKFKTDVKAVNFDPMEEELESFLLDKFIGDNEIICDLGCGNGRTILSMALQKKNTVFYGLDFSKNMIEVADAHKRDLQLQNVHFLNIDATLMNLSGIITQKFDKVLTKRLLINLKGDAKFRALDNIYSLLKNGGSYLMIECFIEPLQRINEIRRQLDLEEIKVKFFNEYLSFDILEKMSERFCVAEKIDFGSLYYFISRVFNAYLSEGEPDYNAPINRLAVELIKKGVNPIEGYSPEIMFLFKKK
ncbi:MAG: class I SAM-dependent methyltransferase [Nitrospirota bacterium]